MFAFGRIHLSTLAIHTVKPLKSISPAGPLRGNRRISDREKIHAGASKALIPALSGAAAGQKIPRPCPPQKFGITRAQLIDASPLGTNIRSTAATYADVHDELRKVFARTADAKAGGWKSGDFSYNTGRLAVPPATAPAW